MSAVLAVLLTLLKIIGIVLLVLLALIFVALILPAGIAFSYTQPDGVTVRLCYGPVRFTLYPRGGKQSGKKKERAKTQKAKAEQPKKKTAEEPAVPQPAPPPADAHQSDTENAPIAAAKGTAQPGTAQATVEWAEPAEQAPPPKPPKSEVPPPAPPEPEPQEPKKKDTGSKEPPEEDPGLVERIRAAALADPIGYVSRLFDLLGVCAGPLLRRMQVRGLRVYWTVTGSDAAETGIQYGKTIATLNTVLLIARDHIRVQADELRLEPDFTGENKQRRAVSFRFLTRPLYLVVTAARMAWRFWRDPVLLPPKPKKHRDSQKPEPAAKADA